MTNSAPPIRRWLITTVLGLLMVILAGCQVEALVDVTVAEDGSGTVRATVVLDRAAASALVDLQRDGIALADLSDTGWQVEAPETSDNGSLRLSAVKPFGTPEQFASIMAELTGEAGLFEQFSLTRTKAFAKVDYSIEGELVPSGLDAFADSALIDSLGRPLSEIAQRYDADAGDVVVRFAVSLPGTLDPAASGGVPDPSRGESWRVWTTRLDNNADTTVTAASATRQVQALVWRGIAVVALVLAGLVAFGHVLRVLRPERRRGKGGSASGRGGRGTKAAAAKVAAKAGAGKNASDPAAPAKSATKGAAKAASASGTKAKPPEAKAATPVSPAPVKRPPITLAAAPTPPDEEAAERLAPTVVALDGMGVIYQEGNDINDLLLPFVQRLGSPAAAHQIAARARALTLGRMTTAEFWASIGVQGDAHELDEAYLERFHLTPGVIRFLRSLRAEGIRVACLTNDASTWASMLRLRHSLEGLIDPWIVSGSVGVRKPDRPMFEVLRRTTGEPPERILIVDDDLDILDAARSYGFQTAWFAPTASLDESRQHPILRSFDTRED